MRTVKYQPGAAPLAALTGRGLPARFEAARIQAELKRRAAGYPAFYDVGPSGLGEPRLSGPTRSAGRSDTQRRAAVIGLAGRCRRAGAVARRAAATPAPARSAVGDSAVRTLHRVMPHLQAYKAEIAAGRTTPDVVARLEVCRDLAVSCLRYSDK